MFLHKCCFLTEDDMSIPSFERPCSSRSRFASYRASNAGYELQCTLNKDIVFIKKCPKIWLDHEDEAESSSFEDSSSIEGNCYDSNSLSVQLSSRSRIFLDSCSDHNRCTRQASRTPTYTFKLKMKQSSITKVLDWIMSCCWKCSPGCQQLPAINI